MLPHQLARIYRSEPTPLSPKLGQELCAGIERLSGGADALRVSDYKGGVVSEAVIRCVRRVAGERGLVAAVDSQGDLYRFRGFTCVRCNRAEAEAVMGRPLATEADLREHLPVLWRELECGSLVVTRDSEGASFYSEREGYRHLPAERVPVADAVGAGDTFVSVLTLALAAGEPVSVAVHVANKAAALVVQHVGNAYPTPDELLRTLEER